MLRSLFLIYLSIWVPFNSWSEGLPLFYWQEEKFVNFGDYLSRVLVERIVNQKLECYVKKSAKQNRKLLAIGSILYFASNQDIIWGAGVHGKTLNGKYQFTDLDVRAVRGPITRKFLMDRFHIACPEIYGDPALLFPYLFPEFKKKEHPTNEYLIISHYSDIKVFPKDKIKNVIYATDPWDQIIEQILNSKFVVSTSLHGIIIAEAYGIPARLLRISEREHFLKFEDYYLGTNRPYFRFATSLDEALHMGGEPPFQCDLKKLYEAFPFEFWPTSKFHPFPYAG